MASSYLDRNKPSSAIIVLDTITSLLLGVDINRYWIHVEDNYPYSMCIVGHCSIDMVPLCVMCLINLHVPPGKL
jgi:hypothetical protein